jgi:hypothetical protein
MGFVAGIPLQGGIAQEDVPGSVFPGGNDEGDQGGPEVRYGKGQFPRFQGIKVGFLPRGEEPEGSFGDLHGEIIAERGKKGKGGKRLLHVPGTRAKLPVFFSKISSNFVD